MHTLHLNNIKPLLAPRLENSYKGNFGRIAIIDGNEDMGGAGILASSASLYSGAGLVTTYTALCNHAPLHARLPEAMVKDWDILLHEPQLIHQYDIILIGPGLGVEAFSATLLTQVIEHLTPQQTLIMDASALRLWQKLDFPAIGSHLILTPHLGEWSALTCTPIDDITIDNSRIFLQQHCPQGILVLKSHETKIITVTQSFKNPLGNPGMAIGGMGDVLAGMISGFIPQTNSLLNAVNAAVYTHSYIGDMIATREHIVLPSRLIDSIPAAMYTLFH